MQTATASSHCWLLPPPQTPRVVARSYGETLVAHHFYFLEKISNSLFSSSYSTISPPENQHAGWAQSHSRPDCAALKHNSPTAKQRSHRVSLGNSSNLHPAGYFARITSPQTHFKCAPESTVYFLFQLLLLPLWSSCSCTGALAAKFGGLQSTTVVVVDLLENRIKGLEYKKRLLQNR